MDLKRVAKIYGTHKPTSQRISRFYGNKRVSDKRLRDYLLALNIEGTIDSFAIIMLIDLLTFLFAIAALLIVYIPQPPKTVEGEKSEGSIWQEAIFGFKYIFKRPSLLGLQMIFFVGICFLGWVLHC